jgi:hypothetical protein
MAGRWKIMMAMVIAGHCFSATLTQAQQSGEPQQVVVPAQSGWTPPTNFYVPRSLSGARPAYAVQPVPAPRSAPTAQATPVTTGNDAVTPKVDGQVDEIQNCTSCSAGNGKSRPGGLFYGQGCGCGGDGQVHPIHHFFLLDCWAHHDEHGCSSLCSELRFAFGSCRAYFGEKCGPTPPMVPVPPGYTILPPDPRNGPVVEVPPNRYPPAMP